MKWLARHEAAKVLSISPLRVDELIGSEGDNAGTGEGARTWQPRSPARVAPSLGRPPWRPGGSTEWTRFPICRFRDTNVRTQWSLHWRDRHLELHEYDLVAPTPHLDELLDDVANDRSGIFWG